MGWSRIDLSVDLDTDQAEAWRALTAPAHASKWLGELEDALTTVGQATRLWVGPGDFHGVWVEGLQPPDVLSFTMAHLGVAEPHTVTFTAGSSRLQGLRLELSIAVCEASSAELGRLRDLWSNRLDALARHVQGKPEYDDLSALVIEVALAGARWPPLHPDNVGRWLPVTWGGRRDFFVVDEMGPRAFPVTRWHARYDEALDLRIATGTRGEPTDACIRVVVDRDSLKLHVEHSGWTSLGIGLEQLLIIRGRFLAAWREALRQAQLSSRSDWTRHPGGQQ